MKLPFDPSMYVYFRTRISQEILSAINESVIKSEMEKKDKGSKSKDKNDQPPGNKGKLKIDSTCTPSDIGFPTDISLLNESREKTEKIIDIL